MKYSVAINIMHSDNHIKADINRCIKVMNHFILEYLAEINLNIEFQYKLPNQKITFTEIYLEIEMLSCERIGLTNALWSSYFRVLIDMILFLMISNKTLILSSQRKFNKI